MDWTSLLADSGLTLNSSQLAVAAAVVSGAIGSVFTLGVKLVMSAQESRRVDEARHSEALSQLSKDLGELHSADRIAWREERASLVEARAEERKTWVEILAEERRERADREAAMREEERNNLRSLQASLQRGKEA